MKLNRYRIVANKKGDARSKLFAYYIDIDGFKRTYDSVYFDKLAIITGTTTSKVMLDAINSDYDISLQYEKIRLQIYIGGAWLEDNELMSMINNLKEI